MGQVQWVKTNIGAIIFYGFIAGLIVWWAVSDVYDHFHKSKVLEPHLSTTAQQSAPITPSEIISAINAIRVSQSHPSLSENSSLDLAATARARYMAANNVYDATTGNPWSFVTNTGYSYSSANLAITWDQNSTEAVAQAFTTGNFASFGLSDSYDDIGVGAVPATASGGSTQLIVAYVASPQQAQQTYWYCWNTGNPAPHHLGYPVSGDHYCTNQELHNAGFSGY